MQLIRARQCQYHLWSSYAGSPGENLSTCLGMGQDTIVALLLPEVHHDIKRQDRLGIPLGDGGGVGIRGEDELGQPCFRTFSRASRGLLLVRCQELPGVAPGHPRPWRQGRQQRPPSCFVPLVFLPGILSLPTKF